MVASASSHPFKRMPRFLPSITSRYLRVVRFLHNTNLVKVPAKGSKGSTRSLQRSLTKIAAISSVANKNFRSRATSNQSSHPSSASDTQSQTWSRFHWNFSLPSSATSHVDLWTPPRVVSRAAGCPPFGSWKPPTVQLARSSSRWISWRPHPKFPKAFRDRFAKTIMETWS
ncbi:hypothetical protein M427DRAFT_327664 [Gonapodya prolifera JEL478]|uniref:Uncharacterized protein n=1 Tax=Gonapodya prolifera (strain JEL478) TaxID=1344416 RepID=A0A139AEU3_GONPJ|nr:hypothetical protein M427DRAFT_327664 [Gonapodya prolifera JEL478]|eukprot:KXS15321.1 hypothetical protein M427DRAFT_327664 [Gonapodya prolifera JEL478]